MNALCPTTTNTIDAAPHWRVIRDGEKYEILIDDTKDLLASFNKGYLQAVFVSPVLLYPCRL